MFMHHVFEENNLIIELGRIMDFDHCISIICILFFEYVEDPSDYMQFIGCADRLL